MIVALYTRLLRLYPKPFYDLMAEEMTDIFSLRLRDVHQHSDKMLFCLKEFGDLPMNILSEHFQHIHNHQRTPLMIARDITRVVSLVTGFIFFMAAKTVLGRGAGYDIYFLLNLIPLVGLAVAWKWQRVGGLITLLGSLPVGLWVVAGVYDASRSLEIALLSTISHNILYVLCASMFIYLSFRSKTQSKVKFSA